jgi:dihydropyrimidinase
VSLDLALIGGVVVLPGGAVRVNVGISDQKIATITTDDLSMANRTIDVSGKYVLPGLVDPHTHPGNFRPLAPDIASESRSAAVGGVTSMLGTIKVTRMDPEGPALSRKEDVGSYLDQFDHALQAVRSSAHVDVGFSYIIMTQQHAEEIPQYVKECGVTSFKFFLTQPTSTEWGARVGMPVFPDDATVFVGFRKCAAEGALAMVHAENGQIVHGVGDLLSAGMSGLSAWEARFPGMLEASEIRKAAFFARMTGARYYAVHVSSKEGIAAFEAESHQGGSMFAETCPQYLVLDLESATDRGVMAKFNPPVRHSNDTAALWTAFSDGRISTIGSDHVPNLRAQKDPDGTVESGIGGSAGVATLLPLLWSQGVATKRITLERLVDATATAPAKLFGLFPRKGAIQPGADADLVVVDPEARRVVDAADLASWADCSAYEGMELTGWPILTVLRGKVIAEGGTPVGSPSGEYLSRPLS